MLIAGVDIETTGLDAEKGHRIVEIAIEVWDVTAFGTKGSIGSKSVDCVEQRINPMRSIDKAAEAVHGISLFDLKDEPKWEEIAPKVSSVLNSVDLIVAHNADFDIPFIGLELFRVEAVPIADDAEVYCTMQNGRGATAMGKLPNLREFCFAFDVDYDPKEAHSALYDVKVMMQALLNGVHACELRLPGSL